MFRFGEDEQWNERALPLEAKRDDMKLARTKAVSHTTRKGVRHMPITLTLHIGKYTVTLTVKRTSRHPAR